jgi:undecaprenyl diphosphate synthase
MDAPGLRQGALPRHVAVIMDGNGRWAERRGLERSLGHRAGVEAVRAVTRAAREIGISWLTLYAFSSENWNRPKAEVDALMRLPEEYFASELEEAVANSVRIRALGRRDRLPPSVRRSLDEAVERTQHGTGMQLVFALSYGGRGEIVDAARRLLREHDLHHGDPDALDEKEFAAHLDEPELPDVDLLIRTGGEQRISNFLLWQSAYAELHFAPELWPDFGRAELLRALEAYQARERRFGRTSAQLSGGGRGPAGGAGR